MSQRPCDRLSFTLLMSLSDPEIICPFPTILEKSALFFAMSLNNELSGAALTGHARVASSFEPGPLFTQWQHQIDYSVLCLNCNTGVYVEEFFAYLN